MFLQNLWTILIIFIFFNLHLHIRCEYLPLKDVDSDYCKYGMHSRLFPFCDCSKVVGNGTRCEIEKPFNDTDFLVVYLCLNDTSQSWKKNLEIQFPEKSISIIEENKKYVKGLVKYVSFEIYYFCEKPAKNIFWWPKISKKKKRTQRASKSIEEKDISRDCNFGINEKDALLPHCDCNGVLGNGPHCEITFNRDSHYKYILCLTDNSQAWKKNLEIQFPKKSVNIIEERQDFVKGFIGNHISFEVTYFCKKPGKNQFLWPEQSQQSSKNSSQFGNTNVTRAYNPFNGMGTNKLPDSYNQTLTALISVVVFSVVLNIILIVLLVVYMNRNKMRNQSRTLVTDVEETNEDHRRERQSLTSERSSSLERNPNITPVTDVEEINEYHRREGMKLISRSSSISGWSAQVEIERKPHENNVQCHFKDLDAE